jgi:hypothetical protein
LGLTINNPRNEEANKPTSRYRLLEGVFEMNITKELLDNAEAMQRDKIAFIDAMAKKDPKATYEALSDVYWYLKITELKQEINELREQLLPTLS